MVDFPNKSGRVGGTIQKVTFEAVQILQYQSHIRCFCIFGGLRECIFAVVPFLVGRTFVLAGTRPGGGFPLPNSLTPQYLVAYKNSLLANWQMLAMNGITFAGALMLMLLAHEMGHYMQARRYGVPATLPFFIPMPITPFGTMGAVIIQAAGVADRKSLFDIAITGPLAGLVVALPITYIGLQDAAFAFVPPNATGLIYGDPLILQWMIDYVHGPRAEGQEVLLNPLLFAGWVGIFITALNLIPIGQLDGGHLLYTLIGKRSHFVAVVLLGLAVAYMILSRYYAYGLMVILLLLMGPRHPPTANDEVPLGVGRIILGWLTLAFIIIGFTPQPIIGNF